MTRFLPTCNAWQRETVHIEISELFLGICDGAFENAFFHIIGNAAARKSQV